MITFKFLTALTLAFSISYINEVPLVASEIESPEHTIIVHIVGRTASPTITIEAEAEVLEVVITDENGNEVYATVQITSVMSIDMSSEPAGSYTLTASTSSDVLEYTFQN